MKTDLARIPTVHVYELVIVTPDDDDRVRYQSVRPFGSFQVGDEVTTNTYSRSSVETVAGAVVARVMREVALNDGEILDTTWLYLAARTGN